MDELRNFNLLKKMEQKLKEEAHRVISQTYSTDTNMPCRICIFDRCAYWWQRGCVEKAAQNKSDQVSTNLSCHTAYIGLEREQEWHQRCNDSGHSMHYLVSGAGNVNYCCMPGRYIIPARQTAALPPNPYVSRLHRGSIFFPYVYWSCIRLPDADS